MSLCSLCVSEECGDFRNVYEVFSRLGWSRQIKCEWFFRSNSLRLAESCTSSKKCLDKNKHVSVSLSICLESGVFIGNWARFNKKEKLVQAWGRCFTEICAWLLPNYCFSQALQLKSQGPLLRGTLCTSPSASRKNHILKGEHRTNSGAREMEVRSPAICPGYFAPQPEVLRSKHVEHGASWQTYNRGPLILNCPALHSKCHLIALSFKYARKQRLGPQYHYSACTSRYCASMACQKLGQYIFLVPSTLRSWLICHGLNVYIPPKFTCWSPNPQYGGIGKWGLLEGDEDRAPLEQD